MADREHISRASMKSRDASPDSPGVRRRGILQSVDTLASPSLLAPSASTTAWPTAETRKQATFAPRSLVPLTVHSPVDELRRWHCSSRQP
jgi:hypothetical protein